MLGIGDWTFARRWPWRGLGRERRRDQAAALLVEAGAGLAVLCALAWGTATGWRLYSMEVRPHAVAVPAPRPSRTIVATDQTAVRRYQEALDYLGAAHTYHVAGRLDWAREAYERVVALDPDNEEARLALTLLALEPEPTPSPEEQARRQRIERAQQLAGEGHAYRVAGRREWAAEVYQRALALDPGNPDARRGLTLLGGAASPAVAASR